jgi:drug/metabolite transporter (DMT)-like permease
MNFLGELASLATSVSFSFGSTFFTLGGRRVGSLVLNRIRLLLAIFFLSITHWVFLGSPIPFQAEPDRWFWLGLSGIVGLVIGDFFLFQAFVWIGPRLSMLMMSLAPVFAAVEAWIFLGETVSLAQIGGIIITLIGIGWVVMGRSPRKNQTDKNYVRGILYGLGGAMGQASGLVLAKSGLGGDFSPISANLIRMITAGILLWLITFILGEAKTTVEKVFNDRRGSLYILIGALAGPVVGVSFSMLAVQHVDVGIASTLMALPPVFLLPISYFVFKERYGWGAVVGTLLAIAGVGIIFLV